MSGEVCPVRIGRFRAGALRRVRAWSPSATGRPSGEASRRVGGSEGAGAVSTIFVETFYAFRTALRGRLRGLTSPIWALTWVYVGPGGLSVRVPRDPVRA